MKQIEYYIKENGKCPFQEWLHGLDKSVRVQVLSRINRLIEEDNYGETRKLTDNPLSELKFKIGGGIRIYYIDLNDVLVLFLSGGDKSNQKNDAAKAEQYYRDYIERLKTNER